MKKCPKCKAEIQEEARFCLYCMTSFEEKQTIENPKVNNKRWLYIIAAVLVVLFVIISIVLFAPENNGFNDSNNDSNNSSFSSATDTSAVNTDTASSGHHGNDEIGGELSSPSINSPTSNSTNSTKNNTNGNKTTDSSSEQSGSQSNGDANTVVNDSTAVSGNDKNENNNFGSSSTATVAPSETANVTYIYRDAKYGDDFFVGANYENSVVITGVKTVSVNGEYKIPNTIDGKKVVAIMGLAFCDEDISSTVKKVIVPPNVKTIWDYAFSSCYNLTDIYFCGNSIYTYTNAFAAPSKRNATLTIHCSANCNDRDYRYYRKSASYYGAEYQEWNG